MDDEANRFHRSGRFILSYQQGFHFLLCLGRFVHQQLEEFLCALDRVEWRPLHLFQIVSFAGMAALFYRLRTPFDTLLKRLSLQTPEEQYWCFIPPLNFTSG